jgi:O-antigen/teichoic acid export membrane protein
MEPAGNNLLIATVALSHKYLICRDIINFGNFYVLDNPLYNLHLSNFSSMGIIRKQSIASSIYIYIGFAIGAFNILFLFPRFFTAEEFGLTRLLMDVSMLIAMFCTLGSVPATIKFYPFYKSYLPPQKNDLPQWSLLATLAGTILISLLTYILKDFIIRKFGNKSPLFVEHFYLLFPLIFFYAFWYLFEGSCFSIQKTVLPNFLKEIGFRVLTLLSCVLFIFGVLDFNQFILLFSTLYVLPVGILFTYLFKRDFFNITFQLSSVTRRLWKQIVIFSLFVFSGQALNIVARTADTIVIASQSKNGLADAAVFTIATYLGTLMDVPMRGMTGIASSVIAYAWKDRDIQKIRRIYQKTALTLIIFGAGIWCILLLNSDNLIQFFGQKYTALTSLLVLIGIAKLIDLGTGLNAQILLSSKYWKIDFITSMGFVLLSVPLNVYLVKKYGVIGSAYANLIAMVVYNATRYVYIWVLFKLQPFTRANLIVLILAAACFLITWFLPFMGNIYIDAITRTFVFLLLYGGFLLWLRISVDINNLFSEKILRKKISP